jgi:UDP-N-acetylmuramyl tripeptide synthase
MLNLFAPGIGTIASSGLLLVLGIFAHLRGVGNTAAANNTSATLAQEIEALREFIQTLPSGAKYDTAITAWLQQHQLQAGVATQVLGLLGNEVSNPDAKAAVTEIQGVLANLSKP